MSSGKAIHTIATRGKGKTAAYKKQQRLKRATSRSIAEVAAPKLVKKGEKHG